MALDWHQRSGKSLRDGFCRSLARKGLDFFDMAGVSVVAGYPYSSRHVLPGVVRNEVEESLGASKYEEICKQATILRNIYYCQSSLTFADELPSSPKPLPSSDSIHSHPIATPTPSLINHDYLVLELGFAFAPPLFLRAEKTGHPPELAGLRITVEDGFESVRSSACLFTIRCFGSDLGRVPEVVALLLDFNPDYSLRDQNCWQYARRMARRLVRECRERGGRSEEDARLLEVEEASVERRVVEEHWKRVVEMGQGGMKRLWKVWGNAA